MPEPAYRSKHVMTFHASTNIEATPEVVWSLLLDLRRWPEFDSSIVGVEGIASTGGTINIHTRFGEELPLRVRDLAPGQRMVLRGSRYLGLLKQDRQYELGTDQNGTCQLTVQSTFSGPALPFVGANIPNLKPSFARFVDNIKAHAEQEEKLLRELRCAERAG